MTTQYDYQIGTTAENMVNLEDLFTYVHNKIYTAKADPVDYSRPVQCGDGSVRGLGWLQTTWNFPYLRIEHYNLLKGYCTGLSSDVYIKTRKNDGTFATYTAKMLWPEKEPERGSSQFVMDINIRFIQLAAV